MSTAPSDPDSGAEGGATEARREVLDRRHGLVLPRLWVRWLAYTALGYALVVVLSTGAVMRVPGGLMLTPVLVAAGMALVGFLQWLVLRSSLPAMRWMGWVLATVLGYIAGTFAVGAIVVAPLLLGALRGVADQIGGPALQLASKLAAGGVLGAVLGFAQWLALRRHLAASLWWIPAVSLANAATAVVPPIATLDTGLATPAALIADRVVYGLIVGFVTGATLVWLLRRRRAAASTV